MQRAEPGAAVLARLRAKQSSAPAAARASTQ